MSDVAPWDTGETPPWGAPATAPAAAERPPWDTSATGGDVSPPASTPEVAPWAVGPPAPSGDFGGSPAAPVAPASQPPPQQVEEGASLWNSVARGSAQLGAGVDVLKYGLGLSDPDTFANAIVANEEKIKAAPKTQAELDAEEGGLSVGKVLSHPSSILGLLGESVPAMGATALASVVGATGLGAVTGGAGAPAGAIAGLGLGGSFSAIGSAFKDYLRQQGFDLSNRDNVRAALADPDLVNEAFWYATKQAGVAGVVNAIAGKLGEGVVTRFWNPGATFGEKAAGAAATVGLGAGAGGVQSAGSAIVAGQTPDPSQVVVDSFLGGLLSAPFAIPGFAERAGSRAQLETPTQENVTAAAKGATSEPSTMAAGVEPPPDVTVEHSAAPRPEIIPPTEAAYYSALERYVREKGPESAYGDQWLGFIRNGPVKKEEVDFANIPSFFEFVHPKEKVTKDQLLDAIKADQVRVDVTTLGNNPMEDVATPVYQEHPFQLLPGGPYANPKEFLFRWSNPVPGETFTAPHFESVSTPPPIGGVFRHQKIPASWDLLAHARTTDRVDNEGRRILLVEEAQSDWHQIGEREGYTPKNYDGPDMSTLLAEASTVRNDAAIRARQQFKNNREFTQFLGRPENTDLREKMLELTRFAAQHRRGQIGVPNAPFKTSWPELILKKLTRYAVDKGYDGIALIRGSDIAERNPMTPKLGLFYDKRLSNDLRKLGQRVGARTEEYNISGLGKYYGLRLDSAVGSRVQEGFPLFSAAPPVPAGKVEVTSSFRVATTPIETQAARMRPAAELSAKVVEDLARQFKLSRGIRIILAAEIPSGRPGQPGDLGQMWREPGSYVIKVSLSAHQTAEELYATMAHEFGHVVMYDKWTEAPANVKNALKTAHEQMLTDVGSNPKMRTLLRARDNPVSTFGATKGAVGQTDYLLSALSPAQRAYWTSFSEYFAERVAHWATTSEKPLSVVDKFFSSLGRRIKQIVQKFYSKFKDKSSKLLPQQPKEFSDWLDSFVTEVGAKTAEDWLAMEQQTRTRNNSDLEGMGVAPDQGDPQQPETGGGRGMGETIFGGNPPPEFRGYAAAADRFTVFYKYMLSLPQVAARNRDVRSLQLYNEVMGQLHLERVKTMNDEGLATLKPWEDLGTVGGERLAGLIDDYMVMRYLTQKERAAGVQRKPTMGEFQAMVAKNKVDARGLAVFQKIVKSFSNMLDAYEKIVIGETTKISNPMLQAERMRAIQQQFARLRQVPYFPAMRFGKWTLTVRGQGNSILHFETFTTKRQLDRAFEAAKTIYGVPGMQRFKGVLPEDVGPLMGMPPGLLDLIHDKLDLSDTQREHLEQLRFDLSPAQSFKHRFQRKEFISGYSKDFKRAFANYIFHGATHMTRVKYADRLRSFIKDLRTQAMSMPDGRNRGRIANYLSDHLANVLNPKTDFIKLRGMIFHFALGFNPAAAALNLSQLFVGTAPFLADKFGDFRASGAMLKAGSKWQTYWKEQSIAQSQDWELRAAARAIDTGVLSEVSAPMLAGISEGRNLGKRYGSQTERLWTTISKMSAGLFQLTEKANRRVTFGAALDLAFNDPNNPYVREAIEKTHTLEYARLRDEGWNHREAAAYVTAKDAVQTTQYIYAGYARPPFMRGKAGSLFMFKSFVQNTLFLLWNHPKTAIRSFLVMGFIGGLMGIPGTEDLADILKVLAWQFFGKDFDLEKEARKFVIDMTNNEIVPADVLLHGISRRGYGIPAVMDMLGEHQFPVIDQSASIGIGAISPVPLAPLLGPVADVNDAIATTGQRAAGAAFGFGFNVYKSLANTQLSPTDMKRYEPMVPRAMRNMSQMYRAFSEGQERTASGAPVVRFDVNDTEQMMEALSLGMGFRPLRETASYDRTRMTADAIQFWDLRRQGLLQQLDWARQREDKQAFEDTIRAIQKFNRDLPDEAKPKRITRDSIVTSLKSKAKSRALIGQNIAPVRSNRLIGQEINRLFPEAGVVEQKPVR